MTTIRDYILSNLLYPLKKYPTIIQDTMIEIIADRLEELYNYTYKFPEILSPSSTRLDILKAITDQFLFAIEDDADIEEQIAILENILYVYRKRGSIDTIENMWKYYGGNLPKDVKVVVPSYELFRYSISALSGTHKFIKGKSNSITVSDPLPYDISIGSLVSIVGTSRIIAVTTKTEKGAATLSLANTRGLSIGDRIRINEYESNIISLTGNEGYEDRTVNRPGVYEIRLTNNTYPIPDLREFLIKELVAAGNEIYFTNSLNSIIAGEGSGKYIYDVTKNTFIELHLDVLKYQQGFTWSGYNPLSRKREDSAWSGRGSIFIDLIKAVEVLQSDDNDPPTYFPLDLSTYSLYEIDGISVLQIPRMSAVGFNMFLNLIDIPVNKEINQIVYSTPMSQSIKISVNSNNVSQYPGYFVLGYSKLGKAVI